MAQGVLNTSCSESAVRRMWWAALDTLQSDILMPMNLTRGLWLSSPLPALYEPKLLKKFQGWVWAPKDLFNLANPSVGILPPSQSVSMDIHSDSSNYERLTLLEEDGNDPLLIVITPEIQIALALEGECHERKLLMRSDPETLSDLLTLLDNRLNTENIEQANNLRNALEEMGQLKTNDDLSKVFWPLLSQRLADIAPSLNIQTLPDNIINDDDKSSSKSNEITLLEALTHEIRTPLATIRTLIRSLMRKQDLPKVVANRLKQIDIECTEQIDRFGLIFNAVELERSKPEQTNLALTDLGKMITMLSPVWSNQLERKGLKLILDITSDLPKVLSDSEGLELMLTGLIDRNTRGLQTGGELTLKLRPAGQRLKLQILTQLSTTHTSEAPENVSNEEIGPVLSWNPATGNLQLSQAATQRLLKSLGGRLTNRRDSGITIFFPISELKEFDSVD
nr:sensor histidine kinase [Prochlorococcus marinus]